MYIFGHSVADNTALKRIDIGVDPAGRVAHKRDAVSESNFKYLDDRRPFSQTSVDIVHSQN